MVYRGHVTKGRILLEKGVPLPEGADVRVQVVKRRTTEAVPTRTRRQMLRMPVEQRRRLLAQQSRRPANVYASDAEERIEWQGGDIVE
jgi:hypothetical protein